MKILNNVTLIGIDCVDLKRLQLVADISTKEITFAKVKLLTSIKSNDSRVINIKKIKSGKEYSDFMIKDLHKYIDTDFALIIQYDGFILNPNAWSDDFLKYDYIGAPWYHLGDLRVGNGGFSLRSRKLINWLSVNWSKVNYPLHPEDIFISRYVRPYLEKEGIIFAPESVASVFAWEGCEKTIVWNGQFGFHGGYTDITYWLDKNPKYKNQFKVKFDDYMQIMRKYPIYDGTVHTVHCYKEDMRDFKLLSRSVKNYEARLTHERYADFSKIKIGDRLVFKRAGVSFEKLPIPAFEKVVNKIENFSSLHDLRKVYPNIYVTYPVKNFNPRKWPQFLIRIFGDLFYPKDEPYTIFWFA